MRKQLTETADLRRQVAPLLLIFLPLALLCGGCIAAFFILAAMMSANDWIPASEAWRMLVLSLAAGAALAVIGLWKPVAKMREQARWAAAHLKRGQAERVRLDLPERHLVIDNDGQLLCFFCGPGEKALYFNVGGYEGDPRLVAHEAGHLFRSTWTWLLVPGSSRLWHFETSGAALEPINLVRPHDDDAYDWEEALGFAPWPKDGDMVTLSAKKLGKIGARIARGRLERDNSAPRT
jgi:hypothetical protein